MNIRLRSTDGECRHATARMAGVAEKALAQAREPARKQTHEPERSRSTSREAER